MRPTSSRSLQALTGMAALLLLGMGIAQARQGSAGAARPSNADDGQAQAEHSVVESMSHHHMQENTHMRLTTRRKERPGDRERAAAIVAALRPAIERYRDYRVALQNGFQIFFPELPQTVYHFTNYLQGFAETFRFKPDQVPALLYRKVPSGYDLVGGMYTAPAATPEAELDVRVPLSIAQWHAHVNICLPHRGAAATADWTKFGPEGSIATREACTAAGGRFSPQLFGWMVHVFPFEKTTEKIWAME